MKRDKENYRFGNRTKKLAQLILITLLSSSQVPAQLKNNPAEGNLAIHIAKFKGDRACAVSYTFDDGLREHFTKVFPEFEKRGLKATFWIVGSKMNLDSKTRKDTTRMSWEEVKIMADKGMEMSNHGWAHKNLTKCTPEQLEVEVKKNDSALFACTGFKPVTYCFPGNRHTPEIVEKVSENRVGVRTIQRSVGSKVNTEILDKWIATLIKNNEWGVGMTHGITYGYDAFVDPTFFWQHLDKVKAQDNKVWVGTFKQVMAYTKEVDATQLEVKQKEGYWEITPKSNLDPVLFDQELTAVIALKNKKKVMVRQDGKELPITKQSETLLFDFNPNKGPILIKFK